MIDPAVNVMFCYCCTSEPRIVARLARSIAAQRSLPDQWPRGRKALLYAGNLDAFPPYVVDFFGTNLVATSAHTEENGKLWFNLAKMRNASIDLAIASRADWLALCDADTVILSWAPIPTTMLRCRPRVYWQKRETESLDDSILEIERLGDAAFPPANSWYVIHHTVFGNFRFNENIFGWGYEDVEFNDRLKWAGYGRPEFIPGAVVVHLFHADRDTAHERIARNREIYEKVAHPASR